MDMEKLTERYVNACNTACESISLVRDLMVETNIKEAELNAYEDLHEKAVKHMITEEEVVTLMLFGDTIRETDASLANILNQDCLDLISAIREMKANSLESKLEDVSFALYVAANKALSDYNEATTDEEESELFDIEQDLKDWNYQVALHLGRIRKRKGE